MENATLHPQAPPNPCPTHILAGIIDSALCQAHPDAYAPVSPGAAVQCMWCRVDGQQGPVGAVSWFDGSDEVRAIAIVAVRGK